MEANQQCASKFSSKTGMWYLLSVAPLLVQQEVLKHFSTQELFIVHYTTPGLRKAILALSRAHKISNRFHVVVKDNILTVYEILKENQHDRVGNALFSMKAFTDEEGDHYSKETISFGPRVNGIDFVSSLTAMQAVVNILNRIWVIWPSSRLVLDVETNIPHELLYCSAFRQIQSLSIFSESLFEDMKNISLCAKKLKILNMQAKLPNDFNLSTVYQIEDLHFKTAEWLKVSHLLLNIPAKKAYFGQTNLDNHDGNTIIRSYQQKLVSFKDIFITLKTEADIWTLLEDTVFLRVKNLGDEQDKEIGEYKNGNGKEGKKEKEEEEEEESDDDDSDYALQDDRYCYYLLTKECENGERRLLRVNMLNGIGADGEIERSRVTAFMLETFPTSAFPRTCEILLILNEKQSIEEEVQRLQADIRMATVDLEAYGGTESQCEEAEKLRKLLGKYETKKMKMVEELGEIEKELSAPDVKFKFEVYELFR